MAAPTTLLDFDFNFEELGENSAPILAEPSASGSAAIILDKAWTGDIAKAVILGCKTPTGKFMQVYIAAGGWADTTHATITTRPLKQDTSDITDADTDNDFDLPAGTKIYPVVSNYYFKYLAQAALAVVSSSIKHAQRETYDDGVPATPPTYATVAAGEAAITSPQNGDSFYATAEGVERKYIAGSWGNSTGIATPNMSVTVAGKAEEATVAEQGTAAATGGSGARLVVACANLVKSSSGAGDENKIPVLNSAGDFEDGFISSSIARVSQLSGLSSADATQLTDGSSADDKHIHNKYEYDIIAGTTFTASSSTVQTDSLSSTYVKLKDIEIDKAGIYTTSFYLSADVTGDASTTVYGRVYVNDVAIGTERSWTTDVAQPAAFEENITVNAGDNIQIYAKVTTASGKKVRISNFFIKYDTEYKNIGGTVILA